MEAIPSGVSLSLPCVAGETGSVISDDICALDQRRVGHVPFIVHSLPKVGDAPYRWHSRSPSEDQRHQNRQNTGFCEPLTLLSTT